MENELNLDAIKYIVGVCNIPNDKVLRPRAVLKFIQVKSNFASFYFNILTCRLDIEMECVLQGQLSFMLQGAYFFLLSDFVSCKNRFSWEKRVGQIADTSLHFFLWRIFFSSSKELNGRFTSVFGIHNSLPFCVFFSMEMSP